MDVGLGVNGIGETGQLGHLVQLGSAEVKCRLLERVDH